MNFITPCERHDKVSAHIVRHVNNPDCFGCYMDAHWDAAIEAARNTIIETLNKNIKMECPDGSGQLIVMVSQDYMDAISALKRGG